MRKYYTKDEIIEKETLKIEELEDRLNQEFISDPFCPGGFRKPRKDEIKFWKERIKYSKSIIKYIK